MPDGDKVGDGYIDIGFNIDQASQAKAEAAAKMMQARMAADMDRNIDETTSRQVSAMRSLDQQKQDAEAASSMRSLRNMANELQQKEKAAAESEKRLTDMESQAEKSRSVNREAEVFNSAQRSQKIYEDFDRQRTITENASGRLRNSNAEMLDAEKNRILNMTTAEAAKVRDNTESDIFRNGTNKRMQMFSDAISFLPGRMENVFTAMFMNPVGIIVAAAAATIIGNAFTSALLAAVGLADIGGGIALAILASPELQGMGKKLGSDLFTALKDASSGLERPVMDAMQRLDAAIPMLVAPIKNSFDALAPAIPALTQGIISFGLQMSAMFGEVSRNLMPVMMVFANELLPKLGATLRDFFVSLSKNQDATIAGLRMLVATVDGAIIALKGLLLSLQFVAVGALTIIKVLLDGMANALDGLAHVFPIASSKFHAWADELRGAGTAVIGVTQATGQGIDSMNQYSQATAFSTQQSQASAASLNYQAFQQAILTDQMHVGATATGQLSQQQLNLANQIQNAVSQIDAQFDAVHKNIDADQDWNKKLLDLTDAVNTNGATLDIHTRSGLANRDALEAAAGASRKLWEEDVASGVPVTEATNRANIRTKALLDQFGQTGQLRDMTQQLIDKYGAIPGDVKTVLELQGYDTTNARLQDLRVQQLSLQQGIPISQAQQTVRDEAKGLNKADGGPIFGPGGPRDDKIPAMLSNGEFVLTAAMTKKHWDLINAIHQDKIPNRYYQGGLVQNPITQNWPFPIDLSKTLIPQILFGGGLGTDSGQSVDVIGAIAQIFQSDAHVTSGFRPGSMGTAGLDWHSSGQAADLVSGNMDGLAQAFYDRLSSALLEEIHADGSRHWGVKNGNKPFEYGDALWSQHNDHVHIAMHRDAAESALSWLKGGGKGAFSGALGGAGFAAGASGALQTYAQQLLGQYGWGPDQFGPLKALWNQESGWNPNAVNASSGAYGIPQALGKGHPYNLGDGPAQIRWGLDYIRGRYGSPAAAWAHEQSANWYDHGGYLQPGWNLAYNGLGHPELVQTPEQYKGGGKDVHVYVHDDTVKGLIHCEIKDHEDRRIDELFRGTGG